MRAVFLAGCVVSATLLAAQNQVEVRAPWPEGPPTFRLFFLGHEIGTELDQRSTWFKDPIAPNPNYDGTIDTLNCFFRFVDRGTTVELRASFDSSTTGSWQRLIVKGRNYRLFSTDSEVNVVNDRAHVRDLTKERDIELNGRSFFPMDNYAPIGMQEALIESGSRTGGPRKSLPRRQDRLSESPRADY